MRAHSLVLITIILIMNLQTPNVIGAPVVSYQPVAQTLTKNVIRNWTINLIFVNYDSSIIDLDTILDGLPTEIHHATDPDIIYRYEYETQFMGADYADNLRNIMLENSIIGDDIGTQLNESALEYHETHLDEPQRIFYPRAGREIDAYAVEDWLVDNPGISPPNLGYNFYLLNFSEFDSPDHSFEHWYDYHPVDPDTGNEQDWFRLEWDNALNPNITFEYPGFGGRRGNFYVLDPSADQWYLRWARIWWGDPPYNDQPEHCTMDLEDKVASVDLSTSAGITELSFYLHNYINEPISYLLAPSQNYPSKYVQQGLLRGLVFAMDVNQGISVDSLRWVTNAEMQKAHLEELLPFIDWTVKIDFLDIEQESDWNELFWNYAYVDSNGTTIVDGSSMFYAIANEMRWKYVDIFSENINVFGVVFIKKNMEMHVYNRTYTGLGGNGQTVIWKSWERYYRPDGVTPKDGISAVQLHETMHAIGLMHTWSYGHYAGDFSYGPMGYFAFHNGTATFDQNFVQSTYLDQMQQEVIGSYLTIAAQVPYEPREETLYAQSMALSHINHAIECYNIMDWKSCYEEFELAKVWLERFQYSMVDIEPPEIDKWGVIPENLSGDEFTVWATVSSGLSAIDNVTVHILIDDETELVYPCEFDYSNWTATIPMPELDNSLKIWIEAWDMGMNHAKTSPLEYVKNKPVPYPIPVEVIIIGLVCGVILIAIAVVIRRQS